MVFEVLILVVVFEVAKVVFWQQKPNAFQQQYIKKYRGMFKYFLLGFCVKIVEFYEPIFAYVRLSQVAEREFQFCNQRVAEQQAAHTAVAVGCHHRNILNYCGACRRRFARQKN
jgi:hypothetical protein